MAILTDYLVKLDRAQEHWAETDAAINAFCDNNPNPIEFESYGVGQVGHLVVKRGLDDLCRLD